MRDALLLLLVLLAAGVGASEMASPGAGGPTVEEDAGLRRHVEVRTDSHSVSCESTLARLGESGQEVPYAVERRTVYYAETPDNALRRKQFLGRAAENMVPGSELRTKVARAIEDEIPAQPAQPTIVEASEQEEPESHPFPWAEDVEETEGE